MILAPMADTAKAASDVHHAAQGLADHAASAADPSKSEISQLGGQLLAKVQDHVQGGDGFFVITNYMILLTLSALILMVVLLPVAGAYRRKQVPGGMAGFVETLMLWLRDEIVRPLLGKDTDKFMPLLWTLFAYILINNLLGLIPLYELTIWMKFIGLYPIYGTPTSSILINAGLAIVAFLVIQAYGIAQNGLFGYLKHFTGGTPAFLWPIMIPVEILGAFVKPIALTMRLFANMIAGSLVLKVFVMFVSVALILAGGVAAGAVAVPVIVLSVAMTLLKLFVAFLQAFLFMFLTTLFIAQQQAHGHEEHGHDDHGHGEAHGGHAAGAH